MRSIKFERRNRVWNLRFLSIVVIISLAMGFFSRRFLEDEGVSLNKKPLLYISATIGAAVVLAMILVLLLKLVRLFCPRTFRNEYSKKYTAPDSPEKK